MVIFNVAVVAHCAASGVKVKVVVPAARVLIVAGDHVPVIPFVEAVGKAGATLFWHKGPMEANNGRIWFEISISSVAAIAHCAASGVKVYVVVPTAVVLIVVGDHVPVIPFVEATGRAGATLF